MSDHGEIASLLARLAFKVDKEEFDDEFLDMWTPDGRLAYVSATGMTFECNSAQEILQATASSYKPPSHPCLHIVTNPVIDLDGDKARARYYTIHTLHGPVARPVGVGEYDTYLRRGSDGKWRMHDMTQWQKLDYEQVAGSDIPPKD